MRNMVNLLSIGCWNIHGLFTTINKTKLCKLDDEEFIKKVNCYDILCLQEIQCGPSDTHGLSLDGYSLYPFHREISKNNRYFGGSLIFIKRSIKKGVTFIKNVKGDIIWIKLIKKFFGLSKDILVCFAYAPPMNSPYVNNNDLDVIDLVEKDISSLRNSENILIAGDLNAKTKTETDCVSDLEDDHSPIINSNLYISDNCFPRHNRDNHPVDEQGRKFIELCKNSRIRILNGRMPGDRLGAFTRYPLSLRESPSTIDYMASDDDLMKKIKSFVILPHNGLSDHDPIRVTFETMCVTRVTRVIRVTFEPCVSEEAIKIIKNQNIQYVTPEQFKRELNSPVGKKILSDYMENHSKINIDSENMYADLNNIFTKLSHKAKIRYNSNKKHK